MITTHLLLDMDGPMADFDRHFFDQSVANGWDLDIDDLSMQEHRFLTDHQPSKAHQKAARAAVEGDGWFRALPVVPGAQEGVAELLSLGVEITVCTKPLEASYSCPSEKFAWIAEHFPDLVGHVMLAPDKSRAVGNILLDDAIKMAWIPQARWVPVCFTAPFNGAGSEWSSLPHWSWGDPVGQLLNPVGWISSPDQHELSFP